MPRQKKKPLIGQTHDDRANVGKIDKPNAEIVALRDNKSDIAKGTESQIDDVAKTERDKAAEAKTVKTTPQMIRFRDAKVCNNLATDEIDDHRIQSDHNKNCNIQKERNLHLVLRMRGEDSQHQ